MGAAAALDYVGAGHSPFARIVGIAPMLGLYGFAGSILARQTATMLTAAGMGRMFVPGGGPQTLAYLPFARNILTGDRRRFDRAKQILDLAPALGLGDPTIAWIHSAYGLMERLNADGFAENIKTPALMIAVWVRREALGTTMASTHPGSLPWATLSASAAYRRSLASVCGISTM